MDNRTGKVHPKPDPSNAGTEQLGFTQHKGRNKSPVRLEIPIIPELRRIIEASPTGDLTYLLERITFNLNQIEGNPL